ncbi:MAG: hypothetical protein M3Q60_10250 [Actinomycetota bacterium]|nr:hypothetical protein [Actinomycetota bacterium]
MHLATDYVHAFEGRAGIPSRCRIRIYVSDDPEDADVVVASELLGNPGIGATDAAQQLAAEVIGRFGLSVPVWIEHHPLEATHGRDETFDLVIFGHCARCAR